MTVRPSALDPAVASQLARDAAGLFPAVAQQFDTGEVLMVGWMDDEALHRTLTTGRATYWSRSRREYWVKGETSGHVQWVRSVALDCDGDTVLVRVDQVGPACHTGTRTCFEGRAFPAVVVAPPADRDEDGEAEIVGDAIRETACGAVGETACDATGLAAAADAQTGAPS